MISLIYESACYHTHNSQFINSMKKYSALFFLFCLYVIPVSEVEAQQLRLPDIFSDNMVLQQQTNINFHGYAGTQQSIKVVPGWTNDTLKTTSDSNAEWTLDLRTPDAGGPYQITVVDGDQQVVIHNVLIGEVWLASGQSNMEMSADWHPDYYKKDIGKAGNKKIRFFKINKVTAPYPQKEVRGEWKVATPASMRTFSLAGYFFGRRLNQKLGRPIGLIESAWGGTPVEAWTPNEIFKEHAGLAVSAAKLQPVPWCPMRPAVTYNAMIHPIAGFPIAGAIWYQGETNTANPETYEATFSDMIQSWRRLWQQDFPFYFVQIAPYTYDTPQSAALVREQQLETYQHLAKTGMVVTTDITGDTTNIHPKDKQDVGERLARWALAKNYDQEDIIYSGPIFDSMEVNSDKAILHFDFAEKGLMKKGRQLRDFVIAGENHHFVKADAQIKGTTVIVSSSEVEHPKAVRMGFSNTAIPNLFNKSGLPASPFRTDDWVVDKE